MKIGRGPAAVTGDVSAVTHHEVMGRGRITVDPEARRPVDTISQSAPGAGQNWQEHNMMPGIDMR